MGSRSPQRRTRTALVRTSTKFQLLLAQQGHAKGAKSRTVLPKEQQTAFPASAPKLAERPGRRQPPQRR